MALLLFIVLMFSVTSWASSGIVYASDELTVIENGLGETELETVETGDSLFWFT